MIVIVGILVFSALSLGGLAFFLTWYNEPLRAIRREDRAIVREEAAIQRENERILQGCI